MIKTGVEALDSRLGGLEPGALYCLFGTGSAGKSVLGLHFLIEGLERGDSCVLVTADEPVMIESRALYLGHAPGTLIGPDQLRIVRLPPRLPGNLAIPPGEALAGWLKEQLHDLTPRRIVFDAVDALGQYSETPGSLLEDVARFLRETGATSYVLACADREANVDTALYAPLLGHAAGAFRLQVSDRGERTFLFHTVPAGAFRTEPFAYSLRIGAGFTEELALEAPELSPEERRRVLVLDEIGALSGEFLGAMGNLFELEVLTGAGGALGRLSAGRYGALLLVVDPFDEARTFDLAFALRKDGNPAPIVFAAPSHGLRSTTRSRGLRLGGDDFFVTDLPAAEAVERVQMAWLRGSHRRSGLSQIGQIIQPVNGNGLARPMTESEFTQAMSTLLAEQPPLFFCYLEFTLRESMPEVIWPSLRTRVRLGDGDLIGQLSNRRFGCVLDRITAEQTWRVVDRIKAGHPALQAIEDVVVLASPMRADDIRARIAPAAAPDESARATTGWATPAR